MEPHSIGVQQLLKGSRKDMLASMLLHVIEATDPIHLSLNIGLLNSVLQDVDDGTIFLPHDSVKHLDPA